MSITKSYNKQTDTYYAYETTYEWSDEKQKKVQRKRCIGKFDSDTGMVIPNGKVGRPSLSKLPGASVKSETSKNELFDIQPDDIKKLTARLNKIEESLQALSVGIHDLRVEVESLSTRKTQESDVLSDYVFTENHTYGKNPLAPDILIKKGTENHPAPPKENRII